MKILFKEIQDRFGEENEKIGPPVVERLAVNVRKMVEELRKNAAAYKLDEFFEDEGIKAIMCSTRK